MATSGSVDWGYTGTQLIEAALRKCGILGEGETATTNQTTEGLAALNPIIKEFQASGMPLWAIVEVAVFPINDTNQVTLGASGGHAATSWAHTQLATAAASAATSLSVDSITGIATSANIGVELDSGNMHWTTVSGAPSGTTVTLASGLASAAAIDNHIYAYTTKTVRPVRISLAQLYDYQTSKETPMNIVSREEYEQLGDKTQEGTPNQVYYDPQLTRGVLHFYPRFQNGDRIFRLFGQRPFEDMDAITDTLDFPQEWESAIVWELAAVLAFEKGVPVKKLQMIQAKAKDVRNLVEGMGMEEGSIYIKPVIRGYR